MPIQVLMININQILLIQTKPKLVLLFFQNTSDKKDIIFDREVLIRKTIFAEVWTAFSLENFAKLENMYNIYREKKTRTPSGLWELSVFYNGIENAIYTDAKTNQDGHFWQDLEAKALAWIKAYPQSPAARISYSKILILHGWKFRGEDFANKVTPEGWKQFFKNIKLARENLENNKNIAIADPEWYTTMLDLAKFKQYNEDTFYDILNEAVTKEPYYYNHYFFALQPLLPKWGGNWNALEVFADRAVDITKECDGQGLYARIY